MILKTFLSQYINEEDVKDIIFHSGNIIIKDTFKTIIFLGILYGLYYWLNSYIHWPMLPWIFWIIGILILIKYAITFFDKAVDCIILSDDGITFFSRDWLYKYKTDFFWRDSIETISHQQNSFRDKLFVKWDLKIQLEHEIMFDFEEVSMPKKQAKKIMKLKNKHDDQKEEEPISLHHSGLEKDEVSILSEALSDVIKDYLDKKNS